jgi:hypothetical protein
MKLSSIVCASILAVATVSFAADNSFAGGFNGTGAQGQTNPGTSSGTMTSTMQTGPKSKYCLGPQPTNVQCDDKSGTPIAEHAVCDKKTGQWVCVSH